MASQILQFPKPNADNRRPPAFAPAGFCVTRPAAATGLTLVSSRQREPGASSQDQAYRIARQVERELARTAQVALAARLTAELQPIAALPAGALTNKPSARLGARLLDALRSLAPSA